MSHAPTILAVDGNSLGHRAFHSTRDDSAAGPRPVTATVISMLAGLWQYGPYDAIAVAFDHPTNRRKHDFAEYKAQRGSTDPQIHVALDQLQQDLSACGMCILQIDGAEADDILASIADDCTSRRWRCDIASSDRDLIALISPSVRLLRPRASFGDLEVADVDRVRATLGIEPHQYLEFAALRGDPSDGLAGVPGIGPKTAARLIRDYVSVEGVFAAIGYLPPRLASALQDNRDIVERNMLLMSPIPHLDVDVAAIAACELDVDRVYEQVTALQLHDAATRFRRIVTAPTPSRPPMPPPPEEPR